MLQSFPLLTLSLIAYAMLNLTGTDPNGVSWHETEATRVQLMSGDAWQISFGHLFLACSLWLLFIELLRATRSDSSSLLNHALSVLVFVAALLLFLLVRGYGNSTFFMFTSMTLLDFMAGFIITTMASRRALAVGRVDD
jgi:hypothetical protein